MGQKADLLFLIPYVRSYPSERTRSSAQLSRAEASPPEGDLRRSWEEAPGRLPRNFYYRRVPSLSFRYDILRNRNIVTHRQLISNDPCLILSENGIGYLAHLFACTNRQTAKVDRAYDAYRNARAYSLAMRNERNHRDLWR